MPNNIKNRLTINGTKYAIRAVKEFLKSECRAIDFNKITPTPKWVFQGNISFVEEEKYGAENCWYQWNLNNWGTKWNAYETKEYENVIEFETAWNGVPKLMSKLALIFHDIELKYQYADEKMGYNVGSYTFKGTEIKKETIMNQSKEAYELYFDLWDCRNEYKYNPTTKKYEHIVDEEE